MRSRLQNNSLASIVVLFLILFRANTAFAQSTSFTYQGRLTDGGTAANGNYDLQFGLWTSLSGGSQVGSTQTLNTVAVSNGVFTVNLDFGANAFPGATRFLEISARPAGSGSFTLLSPRQPITSTPYAVRSLNAATADSVPASGVPAGSGNYIQNTSTQQVSSNFNISGTGTANIVNATMQYNLFGNRFLSGAGTNVSVGFGTATTGFSNTFVGSGAGSSNTLSGGAQGHTNSFFGINAGLSNTIGQQNAFVGSHAGVLNTIGNGNVFLGHGAGENNNFGNFSVFLGYLAGTSNTAGDFNTAIGFRADVLPDESNNPTNATAIGARARVTEANSLVLGSINGVNGATADTKVGIGTTAPQARLHVRANAGNILLGDPGCGAGSGAVGFGSSLSGCGNYALLGGDGNTYINRPAGGAIIFREANGPNQIEIRPGGSVGIAVLDVGGSINLCRNGLAAIATCGSSLRYKTEVKPFSDGLQLIDRLQPVSFNWKANRRPDIGLIAEEVAQVEPRLTFKNESGQIEGVNYSQLTAVLINAVKEQQAQIQKQTEMIERQQALVNRQQRQLDALKKLACRSHPHARECKKLGVR